MIHHHLHTHKKTALCALAFSTAILAVGCKKSPEKIDLTSTHTTAAETMAPTETPDETEATTAEISESSDDAANGGAGAKKVSTKTNTYYSGKVSIAYPDVLNLSDMQKTEAVDALLKKNALSVLDAWGIQPSEDTVNISCEVLSADRNRITVIYTGSYQKKDAAEPTYVMYSNTIDVDNVSDIGFDRFADPYTMAGYVLSGDCTFQAPTAEQKNLSPNLQDEWMKVKNETSLDAYTNLFTNADFPVSQTFPQSFSYEHQGIIYFSIPMPHNLGDYAIVIYAPDSK